MPHHRLENADLHSTQSRTHISTGTRQRGYQNKITDTADVSTIGGPTKIDSVQNVITLRSDLHDAWVNYEFGVDPDNKYRITAFTNGNADINGNWQISPASSYPRLNASPT